MERCLLTGGLRKREVVFLLVFAFEGGEIASGCG